jgi:hypothetical protein
MDFRGKRCTMRKPARWTALNDFYSWGGRLIPKGSEIKQFETRNFGWTVWTEPNGAVHIAKQ